MGGLKPNHTGLFTVVSDGIMGKDYDYQEKDDEGRVMNLLTVKTSKPMTISGRLKENEGRILVETKDAHLTLVNLEMMGICVTCMDNDLSPITLAKGCSATLEIKGTNIFTPGHGAYQCGINVNEESELTIKGTGNLEARGSHYGAGIGGSGCAAGKIIIESGNIYVGGIYSAIGGGAGNYANGGKPGGTIIIKGGCVYSDTFIGGSDRGQASGSFTLDGDAVVYCPELRVNQTNLNKGYLFIHGKDGIKEGHIYGTPKIYEPWELLKNSSLNIPKEMENSVKITVTDQQVTVETLKD